MNAKILVFVICIEAIIYFLLYNLHDCTFKLIFILIQLSETHGAGMVNFAGCALVSTVSVVRCYFTYLTYLLRAHYIVISTQDEKQ